MPSGAIKPRQQVQVWHDGRYERWQAVRVGADSISGVHFSQPAVCDTCRVALPLATVDSIRYGNPVAGFWNTVGLTFVVIFVTFGIACGRNGCHPGN